jgi:hypothetical protein
MLLLGAQIQLTELLLLKFIAYWREGWKLLLLNIITCWREWWELMMLLMPLLVP